MQRRDWMQALASADRKHLDRPWSGNFFGRDSDAVCDGTAGLIMCDATWPPRQDAPPIERIVPAELDGTLLLTTLGRLRAWVADVTEPTEKCRTCDGAGKRGPCMTCAGTKHMNCSCPCGEYAHYVDCEDCTVNDGKPCADCSATGKVRPRDRWGRIFDQCLNRVLLHKWLPPELGPDEQDVQLCFARNGFDRLDRLFHLNDLNWRWRLVIMPVKVEPGENTGPIPDFTG